MTIKSIINNMEINESMKMIMIEDFKDLNKARRNKNERMELNKYMTIDQIDHKIWGELTALKWNLAITSREEHLLSNLRYRIRYGKISKEWTKN